MDRCLMFSRLFQCKYNEFMKLKHVIMLQSRYFMMSCRNSQADRRKRRLKPTLKMNDSKDMNTSLNDEPIFSGKYKEPNHIRMPVALQLSQNRLADLSASQFSSIDLSLKELDEKIELMKTELDSLVEENKKIEEEKLTKEKNKNPEYQLKQMLLSKSDPTIKPSTVPCGGCGANLHCTNPGIPGFIPAKQFQDASDEQLGTLKCSRCEILGKNKSFKLDIDEQVYQTVIDSIKADRNALVLMIVDVTDIANTLIKDYVKDLTKSKPVVIVGNKVDLIPPDAGGQKHLNRITDRIIDECYRSKIDPAAGDIHGVHLISAKTGFGVEELISKLVKSWGTKGNVYLVGSTNSGKSTLFNLFLDSDFCKSSCRDIVQRATISRWPGTTFDLIKFPLARLSHYDLYLRATRLHEMYKQDVVRRKQRTEMLEKFGKSKNVVLFGSVEKTDFRTDKQKEDDERRFTMSGHQFSEYSHTRGIDSHDVEVKSNINLSDMSGQLRVIQTEEYPDSNWVFDTPGLINSEQLINYMVPEELQLVLKMGMIRPRVYTIQPGHTMFVTGMARIDYLQGSDRTLATVHIHHSLPVSVVKTEDADDFYMQNRDFHAWDKLFKIPVLEPDRFEKIPPLEGKHFTFSLSKHVFAEVDIQLSSLGWVSFAGDTPAAEIKVSTIGGKGIHMRTPALLPNILTFKGNRVKNSQAYALRKLKPKNFQTVKQTEVEIDNKSEGRIKRERKVKQDIMLTGKTKFAKKQSLVGNTDFSRKESSDRNTGEFCKVEKLFPD